MHIQKSDIGSIILNLVFLVVTGYNFTRNLSPLFLVLNTIGFVVFLFVTASIVTRSFLKE